MLLHLWLLLCTPLHRKLTQTCTAQNYTTLHIACAMQASETLRDIYHTAFGLGGLVQTAEQAWQQHEDVYSSNSHALLAALELHARIINADAAQNPGLLPPGFKKFKDMPEPPASAVWRFDIRSQRWFAQDKATGKTVSYLQDGVKYLLGIGHLPTGGMHWLDVSLLCNDI